MGKVKRIAQVIDEYEQAKIDLVLKHGESEYVVRRVAELDARLDKLYSWAIRDLKELEELERYVENVV